MHYGDAMSRIKEVATVLRDAGLDVKSREGGPGNPDGATEVVTKFTGTPVGREGPLDLSTVVLPSGGVAYVQRDGLVWLLAEGPRTGAPIEVWVASASQRAMTKPQRLVVSQVEVALRDAFGVTEPDDDDDEPDDED